MQADRVTRFSPCSNWILQWASKPRWVAGGPIPTISPSGICMCWGVWRFMEMVYSYISKQVQPQYESVSTAHNALTLKVQLVKRLTNSIYCSSRAIAWFFVNVCVRVNTINLPTILWRYSAKIHSWFWWFFFYRCWTGLLHSTECEVSSVDDFHAHPTIQQHLLCKHLHSLCVSTHIFHFFCISFDLTVYQRICASAALNCSVDCDQNIWFGVQCTTCTNLGPCVGGYDLLWCIVTFQFTASQGNRTPSGMVHTIVAYPLCHCGCHLKRTASYY